MVDLPSGTVTFLFTDVEGSTRLWDSVPELMGPALKRHDTIVRSSIEDQGGYVFATGGDGFAAAFTSVADGVKAAQAIQHGLDTEEWDPHATIRVRVGLHLGEVEERDGDYFGPAVNRAARIMHAGHGGQVLVSASVAEIVGSDELKSLGRHRLQGFGAPEELWQLGPGEFPALRTRRQRSELPAAVSSFVGRDAELAELIELLGSNRMVTLVGVGGVGKTRLALEAARRVDGGLADGAWFVDLAPRRDPDGVAEAIASALGVIPQPGKPTRVAVIEYLRDRQALLVLDNCEHLIDGAAALCSELLREAADVSVLATSREPVAIAGERVWPMPSLRQSRELFVERAIEADARFEPSPEEIDVIDRVCERLDGIPLAIELAAARTRSMTVAEIQDRLDDRFRLLRGSGRGGVERHQTLQATVQWSYDLLDDIDRGLFELLSVFPGSFDSAAVEAICAPVVGLDEWEVRDALDRLVERSLALASREGQSTRFRMLETFRQFGEQRLDHDTATAVHRSHLTYFSRLAWDSGVGYVDLLDEHDSTPWRAERDNIRAAMDWAMAEGDDDACERLTRALIERYIIDFEPEFEEWIIEAAARPTARAVTVALAANSSGYGPRGDFTAALELARRAIELDPEEPWTWSSMGLALFITRGPSVDAASAFVRAATLLAPEKEAMRAMNHALAAAAATGVDESTATAQVAEVQRALNSGLSPRGTALAEAALTRVAISRGELDKAIELCERTLEATAADAGSRLRLGAYLIRAEALSFKTGANAGPAFRQALEPVIELGWWGQIWRTLVPLARWWTTTGNREAAALIVGRAAADDIGVAGLDEVSDALTEPSLGAARQRGAHMNSTELLEYVLAELDPVAVKGTLGT